MEFESKSKKATNMKKNEIWREYPFNLDFEITQRLEFSNLGRVKSYSKSFPEGNIIKGSLQGGYPIIRLRIFQKRTEKQEEKLRLFREEIDGLNEQIKSIASSQKITSVRLGTQLKELHKKRDQLLGKHKFWSKKINNRRAVNIGILVHKAVVELFLPTPEKEQQFVIHKDFDKLNNCVDNLAWATKDEILARQKKHPKVVLYEFKKQFEDKKPVVKSSKLKENDVLFIKQRLDKGDTLRKLAQQFNVSDMQIHRIKTGENWGHVKSVSELRAEMQK